MLKECERLLLPLLVYSFYLGQMLKLCLLPLKSHWPSGNTRLISQFKCWGGVTMGLFHHPCMSVYRVQLCVQETLFIRPLPAWKHEVNGTCRIEHLRLLFPQ